LCLGLALAADRSRLWLLAAAGVLLSLGEYAPFGPRWRARCREFARR
jgi:hypothetical protein